jgi:hypothetical protein
MNDEELRRGLAAYVGAGTLARPVGFDSTFLHFYERQSEDSSGLEIYCYTDRFSYAPGETVSFHVSTTTDRYAIEVQRDGAVPVTVYREASLSGARCDTPPDCSVEGCGWPVSHRLEIPSEWPSGFYRVFVSAERDGEHQRHEHFFVVRPEGAARRASILFVHSTATWTAYNSWGGSCHYGGICGPEGADRSSRLSILRPFERGFLWLPTGAPRIPTRDRVPPGAAAHYPSLTYAFAKGLGKFYSAAGYATYQRPFLVWGEEQGFAFDHITQHDLHFRPDLLDGYACVLLCGHDEYWTRAMREAIDAYVDAGGHVARFGGNFMWQIRLEDEGRTQVCHWGVDDPVEGTDRNALLTGCWEDLRIAWPGAETMGLNASTGIYARISGASPRGAGGFTVYRPEHWSLAGTDLYYGDVFGAEHQIAGYELDGVHYTFREGLPHPTRDDGAPENLEIVAMVPTTTGAEPRPHDESVYFVGEPDHESVAQILSGEVTPESVERHRRGAGMMAGFTRGRGAVFNAASCEWVSGLIHRDVFTERITRNVLERFTSSGASW